MPARSSSISPELRHSDPPWTMASPTAQVRSPGQRFGRYEIGEVLGFGATAIVYRARRDDGLEVALKLVDRRRLIDASAERRIQREAALLAGIEHPGVVRVLDYGADGDVIHLALALADGPSLADLVVRRSLSLADTVRIVGDLASALEAVHAVGIVHRDVKPENVLIDRGRAVLADFGIAHSPAATHTRVGAFLGSAHYAAPEQVRGEAVGPETDVYALAALAWTCLTGRPPFDDELEAAVIHGHLHVPPPEFPGPPLDGDRALLDVLHAGLTKDPADRPASASAWATALAEAAAGTSTARGAARPAFATADGAATVGVAGIPLHSGSEASDTSAVPATARRRRITRRLLPAAGVVGVVAAGVGLLLPGEPAPAAASIAESAGARVSMPSSWRVVAPSSTAPLSVREAATLERTPDRATISVASMSGEARTSTPFTASRTLPRARLVRAASGAAFLSADRQPGRPEMAALVVPGETGATIVWCSGATDPVSTCLAAAKTLRVSSTRRLSDLRSVRASLSTALAPARTALRRWPSVPAARAAAAASASRELRRASSSVGALAASQAWDRDLEALAEALEEAAKAATGLRRAAAKPTVGADRRARQAMARAAEPVRRSSARLASRYGTGPLALGTLPALRLPPRPTAGSGTAAEPSTPSVRSLPSGGQGSAVGASEGTTGASSPSPKSTSNGPTRRTESQPKSSPSDDGEPVVVSAPL